MVIITWVGLLPIDDTNNNNHYYAKAYHMQWKIHFLEKNQLYKEKGKNGELFEQRILPFYDFNLRGH